MKITRKFFTPAILLLFIISGIQCNNSNLLNEAENNVETESTKIGVAIYNESNGEIVHANRYFYFETDKKCQNWSFAVQPDAHSSEEHYHYFAASEVDFKTTFTTAELSWEEIGPALNADEVLASCNSGADGETVTINMQDYYPYNEVYIKIAYYHAN